MIPLVPEFVRPQDGHYKQDCENAAAKRWLNQHGPRLSGLKVTVLGDDLYCHQPLCQLLLNHQLDFILVCRPDSHTTLYDHLEGIDLPTIIRKRWTGKIAETWTYRYLNDLPLKDGADALLVNWCDVTVSHLSQRVIYHNAFVTRYTLSDNNVAEILQAGRTRCTVQNEKYKRHRDHLPTRQTLSDDLPALTRYLYFDNWDHRITFMLQGLELEIPPNSS